MKRFILTSLMVLATTTSFAQSQKAKPVLVKPVAITDTGRTIVQADGSTYIQLQPSEFNQMTAQQIYERARAKFRAMLEEDQEKFDYKNQNFDPKERAGIYRNPNTNPPRKAFYGVSIPGLQSVEGLKFTPTRDERLVQPGKQPYIIANDERQSGVVATADCRNPQGRPDVLGVNFGRSGCYGAIRVFKKLK